MEKSIKKFENGFLNDKKIYKPDDSLSYVINLRFD